MTYEQKVAMLRVLIGETEKTKRPEPEEVLSVYLDQAADKILDRLYPFRDYGELAAKSPEGDPLPEKYHMLQLKIAAYLLNKRGAEGEVQHIENGVHRNYGDADVPEAMLSGIAPYIGIPQARR